MFALWTGHALLCTERALWLPLRSVEGGSHPSFWQLVLELRALIPVACPSQSSQLHYFSPFIERTCF